jgi:sugar porter (SP) family MFS transporter
VKTSDNGLSVPLGAGQLESSGGAYVYLVATVAAIGGFLFGYDLSIISGALLYLRKAFDLDPRAEGFAMASAVIGCMCGAFVVSRLCDSIGRRGTLFISALLYGISAVGTASATSIAEFNVCRAIGGIGVALSSVVSPMYIAEIAPARIRGRLVAINQLAILIGAFASVLVSYVLAQSSVADSWRWMFASVCMPVVLLMIGLYFVPESPRWLAQKGRIAEAAAILRRIVGPRAVEAELAQMTLPPRPGEVGGFFELFRPSIRVGLLVAVALGMFQQFTGASILFANAPVVFQKAGFTAEADAIGQTVLLQLWCVACTAASMWLVDRVGRRSLLLWGLVGMALGQVALGLMFQWDLAGITILFAMFLAIGAYLISLAPLTWLMMSEVFPTRVRSAGMAMGSFSVLVAYFIGLQTFPLMREYFQNRNGNIAGLFYTYGVVCAVAFLFFLKMLPETAGRTLEEISAASEPLAK